MVHTYLDPHVHLTAFLVLLSHDATTQINRTLGHCRLFLSVCSRCSRLTDWLIILCVAEVRYSSSPTFSFWVLADGSVVCLSDADVAGREKKILLMAQQHSGCCENYCWWLERSANSHAIALLRRLCGFGFRLPVAKVRIITTSLASFGDTSVGYPNVRWLN